MDNNELSTNLAEVGTNCSEFPNNSDTISRKWLMECVDEGWIKFDTEKDKNIYVHLVRDIAPSAQPEIIRCRNCKFASGDSRICMKFGHSPIGELDFCAWAERRTDG